MPLAFRPDESHPMVDALLRTRVPRWQELNRAVDERDDMLDFAIKMFDYDRDRALISYFQNALEQFRLVRHIASWRGGHVAKMLDFASGYGRLTRLLVHEHLADELTVSDILEGGMEFQAEQFGVRTILSTALPEDFAAEDKYDLIFVASLFTHLPAVTFTRWLHRLSELLTPSGLLIFTVHDQSLAPEKVDGVLFHSSSESRVLDVSDYGSTWVTEEYVREQVGAGFACVRMPRALAEWQDVYVISPQEIPNAEPRRVPKGFVERFFVDDDGVRLEGWATAVEERADRVEVRLDDEVVATTSEFGARPDVAAGVGAGTATDSGWGLVIPHERIRSFRYQVATVSAFTRAFSGRVGSDPTVLGNGGQERILFLGTLDSLSGHAARAESDSFARMLAAQSQELATVRHDLGVVVHARGELEARIAAMQASRFWKAREKWFAVKRAAGLTDEL
jgi:SAM-dependent methyltransferase